MQDSSSSERPNLQELLNKALEIMKNMTPEEQEAMFREQRENYAKALQKREDTKAEPQTFHSVEIRQPLKVHLSSYYGINATEQDVKDTNYISEKLKNDFYPQFVSNKNEADVKICVGDNKGRKIALLTYKMRQTIIIEKSSLEILYSEIVACLIRESHIERKEETKKNLVFEFYDTVVASPAWPLVHEGSAELARQEWLLPGTYSANWSNQALVAFLNNEPVGIICVEEEDRTKNWSISLGYVSLGYQQSGIYTEMWNRLLEIAKEKGVPVIWSSVHMDNIPMMRFREKHSQKIHVTFQTEVCGYKPSKLTEK